MKTVGLPLSLVKQSVSYDPKIGDTITLEYEGTLKGVQSMASAFRDLGWKYDVSHDGPQYFLTVTTPTNPSIVNETPVDSWNIDTEMVEVSIWSHPKVETFLKQYANRALVKKDILDAIENGTELNEFLKAIPMAVEIYNNLVRGVEGYQIKRHTLTRVRTYSMRYVSRLTIDPVEKFYSTAKLIQLLGIPIAEQRQLPVNPSDKPDGTQWGWRLDSQQSNFSPATARFEEHVRLIFAAWSTLLYDYVN